MEKRIDSFRPALPESLLREYNFFELYPFDGGGRFIQQEIAGSIDDRAITRNILSGGGRENRFPEIRAVEHDRKILLDQPDVFHRLDGAHCNAGQ